MKKLDLCLYVPGSLYFNNLKCFPRQSLPWSTSSGFQDPLHMGLSSFVSSYWFSNTCVGFSSFFQPMGVGLLHLLVCVFFIFSSTFSLSTLNAVSGLTTLGFLPEEIALLWTLHQCIQLTIGTCVSQSTVYACAIQQGGCDLVAKSWLTLKSHGL